MGDMGDMQLTKGEGHYKREKELPLKWEMGLLRQEELPPLNKTIITPILAGVFRISERDTPSFHTEADVENAAHHSFLTLQEGMQRKGGFSGGWDMFRKPAVEPSRQEANDGYNQSQGQNGAGFGGGHAGRDEGRAEWGSSPGAARADGGGANGPASAPMQTKRKIDSNGNESKGMKQPRKSPDADSEDADSGGNGAQDDSGAYNALPRTLKRPRLVWTPQLHRRFVDAVGHLGIKHAVPKTIMQLMNVEGLTRENVASHLQKYRLYLKRMQGLSTDGPTASDMLFASTPIPPSIAGGAAEWHGPPGREDGPVSYRGGPEVAQRPMQIPGQVGLPTTLGMLPTTAEGLDRVQGQSLRSGQQMGGLGLGPMGHRNDVYGEAYGGYEQHSHHHGDMNGGMHQQRVAQPREVAGEEFDRSGESPSRKVLSLFPGV